MPFKESHIKHRLAEPISIVAHQLKNPIAVIKGYFEILLSGDIGELSAKQREYLNDAFINLEKIREIITDLLDVSKIEERMYEVKPGKADLAKIIQGIAEDFFSLARASNCEIVFLKSEKIPLVSIDPIKIHQVIQNLILNAIKYKLSGKGKVILKLEQKGNQLLFSCEDNGVGIPKADFRKVFSKFYRSEEAMNIDPSGTGLGLYVSKAIIELSGGKISFKKNKEAGMTFYFSLPLK